MVLIELTFENCKDEGFSEKIAPLLARSLARNNLEFKNALLSSENVGEL